MAVFDPNKSYKTDFHGHSIEDNSIPATAFKTLSATPEKDERKENETSKGLRVSDKGFLNTAVMRSEITYIDGEAGGMFV